MSASKTVAPTSASESSRVTSTESTAATPITLTQRLGNAGLHQLLRARRLQAKLTVSHPHDSLEQEADRVADQVMRMPAVQRVEDSAGSVPSVDATTEQAIGSLSGRGSAIPSAVRSFMEPRFNADFSAVRVHNDAHAHGLARAVNAQAFTIGPNIVFGAGHYAPDTERGRRLLAHELTHTLQQGAASSHVARVPANETKKPEQIPYKYRPYFIDSDTPDRLARQAERLLVKYNNVPRRHGSAFVLIVVTDRVYIFFPGEAEPDAQFDLTGPRPMPGIHMGSAQGERYYLSYINGSHKPTFGWFGRWEGISAFSKMSAQEERKLLGDHIPVVIVPDAPVSAPAAKASSKNRGGGGATAVPKSSPGTKTTQPSKRKSPIEMKEALSGDEYLASEREIFANYPAFPARLKLSSSLVHEGGANDLTMSLFWGHDSVQAVWNASTWVTYQWERWDITDLLKSRTHEEVSSAQRQRPRDKRAEVSDQYVAHNRRQRIDELKEQVGNSVETINTNGLQGDAKKARSGQVESEYLNLTLAPVSALRSAGGHLIDTVVRLATRPENEIQLEWNEPGEFLIRCVATPHEHEGRVYASSVATAFVEVRPVEYIVDNTMDAAESALLALRLQRMIATDPLHIRQLDEKIQDLEATAHGSAVEALEVVLKYKRAELAKTVGRSERARLKKQLDSLAKHLDFARRNEAGLPLELDGKPTHALRPQAALVSDVTGSAFPLLLQLFEITDSSQPEWVLFDMTTPGDAARQRHIGMGSSNGEAIENAFIKFARANEYGPGTVILRIPASIEDVSKRELVQKNVKGFRDLTRDRLMDLVTVLAAAGIVSSVAGIEAMALGAALAADNLVRRWSNGTLAADATLVSDLLSIFSAIGTAAARVAKLTIHRSEKAFAIATDSADAAAIKRTLKKMAAPTPAAMLDIGNDILNYGGIAWGDYQVLKQIEAINEAERDGAMTHSAASIARSKLLLGAIQNRAFMFAPLVQQPRRVFDPTVDAQPLNPPEESPEWLFQRLERNVPGELPAPLPPRADPPLPSGEYRAGIRTMKDAYDVYNEARASAGGREVGIYHHDGTGEYRVIIGDENGVSAPGEEWTVPFHVHPNPYHALTYRLAAPADFNNLRRQALRTGAIARAFVDYALPDGSHGQTEYGVDPAYPDKPYYVRIHHAGGGVDPPLRFESIDAYHAYWSGRTTYVERGSPQHKEMIRDAMEYLRERLKAAWDSVDGRPGRSTMTGTSGDDTRNMQRPTWAVRYQSPDGVYLVVVHKKRAYFQSLGKPMSQAAGESPLNHEGAFYEFVGAQAKKPPDLSRLAPEIQEHGPYPIEAYRKIGVGSLITGLGTTSSAPERALEKVKYELEHTSPLTTPTELNNWLESRGVKARVDFFGDYVGWGRPPKPPAPPLPPPLPQSRLRLPAVVVSGGPGVKNRVIFVVGRQPAYISTGSSVSDSEVVGEGPTTKTRGEAYKFYGVLEGGYLKETDGWLMKFGKEAMEPIADFHTTYKLVITGAVATSRDANEWLRSMGGKAVGRPEHIEGPEHIKKEPEYDFEDAPTQVDPPRLRVDLPAILYKIQGEPDRVIVVVDGQPVYLSFVEGRGPTKKTRGEAYKFYGVQEGSSIYGDHGRLMEFAGDDSHTLIADFHDLYGIAITNVTSKPEDVNAWLRSMNATVHTVPWTVPFIENLKVE